MAIIGILVTLLGVALSVASLGLSTSTGPRMIMVLAGLAISLFGIVGLINPAYQKNAVWKR